MAELYVKSLSAGKVWMGVEDEKHDIKPKIEPPKSETDDQEHHRSHVDNAHQSPMLPLNVPISHPLDAASAGILLTNSLPNPPTSATVSVMAEGQAAMKGDSMAMAVDKGKEKSLTDVFNELVKWKEAAQAKEHESQLKEQLLKSKDIVIVLMKEKYGKLEMKLKQREEELAIMAKTNVGAATLESAVQTNSMENASETASREQLSRAARAAQLLGVPFVLMERHNEWKEKCEQLEHTAESLRNDFNDAHLKYKTMKRRLRAERKTAAELRAELMERERKVKKGVVEEPIQLNDAEMVTSPLDPVQLEGQKRQQTGQPREESATAISDNIQQAASGDEQQQEENVASSNNAAIGAFPCTKCPNQLHFASAKLLRQHIRRLHNARQCFPCDQCDRSYTTKSGLNGHKKQVHSGLKPFTCAFCQKSFAAKSVWKTHERAHTGERPYVCGVCQKAFVSSGHLRTHERLHTGEKRYCCKYCGKKFTLSGTSSRHQNSCPQRNIE